MIPVLMSYVVLMAQGFYVFLILYDSYAILVLQRLRLRDYENLKKILQVV